MVDNQPIHEGQILTGALFNEPMRVETVRASGTNTWIVGLVGIQSEQFRKVTLNSQDINALTILDSKFNYQGDGNLLRLGLQAYTLGIAYEFDPYFGLSISRVDPLPHQLEAIYVVTDCNTKPQLQAPIKDPARFEWREVTKVAHYCLSVDALKQPMQCSAGFQPAE